MTMLATVQYFCRRTNLPAPTTVMGSTDKQIGQIRALLEEEGQDLRSRGSWEGMTFETTHSTVASEDQGAMTAIAANGYEYIKNGTMWDRTDDLPVLGPLNAQEWQALKEVANTGPRYHFRIRGGKLLVNPVPVAGHTWAFEYVSKHWILADDGTTYREFFGADTDTILLPNHLVLLGLRWRWKKEKGLDYGEDFNTYEAQVKDAMGRDGGKPRLSMDGNDFRGPSPGVFIPQGSWPLT